MAFQCVKNGRVALCRNKVFCALVRLLNEARIIFARIQQHMIIGRNVAIPKVIVRAVQGENFRLSAPAFPQIWQRIFKGRAAAYDQGVAVMRWLWREIRQIPLKVLFNV